MSNPFFGILFLLVCAAAYYVSWRSFSTQRFALALLLLVACGLALRLFAAADMFLHPWDERFHALVAKNLGRHPLVPTLYDNPVLPFDYRNWTSNHVWLHKQPLPLWAMALSLKVFGIGEWALRLPSVLLTTIGIGLTYSITAYLIDKKAAWLAAFLYSINGLIVEIATGRVTTDHIDAFFLFFIELAIFFSILFVRKRQWQWNLLAGLSIGAAILSKWLPALIVLPVWLLLVMDSRSFTLKQAAGHFIVLAAACILVFLPWQLYIHRAFPLESAWEAEFTVRHAREAIEGHAGSVFYFVNRMRINYGELIYLPLFWFTWKSLATPLQYRRLAVLLWFWIPVIFFTFMKTKMQGYILFTAPALFMMTAGFWNWLEEWRKTHRFKWLSVLILFLIIALPVRYSIERLKPFQKTGRNPEWVTDLKALNRLEPQGGILFNYRRPVEAMFYTNFTVYPGLPDRAVLDSLTGAGNRVFINNIDSIPPALRDVPGAALIRLN